MAKLTEKTGQTSPATMIVLIVIVLGLLGYGLKSFVFDSMNTEISALDSKIADLKPKVAKAMAFQEKRALNEQIYRSLLAELEAKKRILPKEKETDELVRKLEKLAKASREIRITLFRPEKPLPKDFYFEWPITINCDAGFNSLGVFFEQIANFDRIFNIRDLSLTTAKRGSEGKPTIKASFVATTFVYTGDETEKVQ